MKIYKDKSYVGNEDGYIHISIPVIKPRPFTKNNKNFIELQEFSLDIEKMDDEWTYISIRNDEGEILETLTPNKLFEIMLKLDND